MQLLKELSDYSGTLSCSDAEENQDKNRFTYNLPCKISIDFYKFLLFPRQQYTCLLDNE